MSDLNKRVLLIILLPLLAVACRSYPSVVHPVTLMPTIGASSQLHFLKLIVQDPDWYKLVVSNTTSSDILLLDSVSYRADQMAFRLYRKTNMGWARMQPMPDFMVLPLAADPGLVISTQTKVTIDTSGYLGAFAPRLGIPLTGTFMIKVRYRSINSDAERVQYSNEFSIGSQQTISQSGLILSLLQSDPVQYTLYNNSSIVVWLIDVCSNKPISYGVDDGVLSLQRLTSEGTWQIIQGNCTGGKTEPDQINPGQERTIDGRQWFNEELTNVGAGVYRWDIVIYLSYDVPHNDPVLRYGHHIFSQTFKYGQ